MSWSTMTMWDSGALSIQNSDFGRKSATISLGISMLSSEISQKSTQLTKFRPSSYSSCLLFDLLESSLLLHPLHLTQLLPIYPSFF